MKKEYIKPVTETVEYKSEGIIAASKELGIETDPDQGVDNEGDMKSTRQGFGKGLWE